MLEQEDLMIMCLAGAELRSQLRKLALYRSLLFGRKCHVLARRYISEEIIHRVNTALIKGLQIIVQIIVLK